MTSVDTIRVKHRDNFESEQFSKNVGPQVSFGHEELDDALSSVGGGDFSGVDSGCYQDHRFLVPGWRGFPAL